MITQTFRAEGALINRKRVQRLMRLMGLESTAPKPTTSARARTPGLPVSATGPDGLANEPGLGGGYYLLPDGARLRLPGDDPRLVPAGSA